MSIKVDIFSSPGCSKCSHAKDLLRSLVNELGGDKVHWQEINILNELDRAVEIGVMSTPAIVIDDELVFSSLPSAKKLRTELEGRLDSIAQKFKND